MHSRPSHPATQRLVIGACALSLLLPGTVLAGTLVDIAPPSTSFTLGTVNSTSVGDFAFRPDGILLATGDAWWPYGRNPMAGADVPTVNGGLLYWNPNFAVFRATYTGAATLPLEEHAADYGAQSAAFGNSIARGFGSLASGYGWAHGNFAAAFGQGRGTGIYSMAAGQTTDAIGGASFAMGQSTKAMGWGSTALGSSTIAEGHMSTALGYSTVARTYGSLATGQWNIGQIVTADGNTVWRAADPVFEVGIGTSAVNRANAMTVYKDGRIIIHKRQGDISMGEFGRAGD